MNAMPNDPSILSVQDLFVTFTTRHGVVEAVRGLSFSMQSNEIVGLVGESGSGKSATCLALGGLLPKSTRIEGHINVMGLDIARAKSADLVGIRGSQLGYIFQDPIGSLNPIRTVGWQVQEAIALHKGSKSSNGLEVSRLLELVGIPDPQRCRRAYPHELSGGMCQRIGIAMALAGDPALIIADEPTTALDTMVQAQVLDLMMRLRFDRRFSLLLVTHDLGLVAQYCDRVIVMQAGVIVEDASVVRFFDGPSHPYSRKLLASVPGNESTSQKHMDRRLQS